jgi:lysophospholipase L1-like esterase
VLLTSALVTTLALSALSFTFVETPIRRDGFLLPTRRAFAWLSTPWHVSRAPRLIAGGLAAVLVLMLVAVLTAPEKSATQRQIESSQAQLEQDAPAPAAAREAAAAVGVAEAARAAAQAPLGPEQSGGSATERQQDGASPSKDWGYRKDDDGLLVPPGSQITAIGDSLIVTSADGLTYRFPETTYVAQSNRQWKDADAVLEDALDQGLVRDNVVVHFGTNAGVKEPQLRSFLDQLGPTRRVVLMNLYGRSSFTKSSNVIIDRVAEDYPLVTVGDWNAAATAQPETLQSDGIHPDIEGMHVYAEVVAEGFDTLARSR